jgi:prolyl-tRNA editing enzyme YbaK/EbsC (Cys-tRNA(Pro) deacylase)
VDSDQWTPGLIVNDVDAAQTADSQCRKSPCLRFNLAVRCQRSRRFSTFVRSASLVRIFLSHSSRDKDLVHGLLGRFPTWLTGWLDEERLLLGTELSASLKDAIDSEVDYVVLFLSDAAANSAWVRQEVDWALEQEIKLERVFLLPVLVGDTREQLAELGLAGRVYLEMIRFGDDYSKLLADQLANQMGRWMSRMLSVAPVGRGRLSTKDTLSRLGESAASLIAEIPGGWRPEVESLLVRPFIDDLAASRVGNVTLTPAQYYQRVLSEMRCSDSKCRIRAVSTLSSELWTRDVDQTRYAELNIEAAHRGTQIQRLFVLADVQAHSFADEIHRQQAAGIETRVGRTSLLAYAPDLEDLVLFETPTGTRAYIAHQVIDGSRRIRKGELVLSDYALTKRRDAFEAAWELALSPSAFFDQPRLQAEASPRPAPGVTLEARRLSTPVITCEEAAQARGIPLSRELKTLLLRTSGGVVAAHLPGDGILSLRKVKARLEAAEAYLADPEDLLELELSAGTVSAVLEPVWSMPHLISRRLLSMSTVMTNNGTRNGYYEFSPALLAEAAEVIVDDFEK